MPAEPARARPGQLALERTTSRGRRIRAFGWWLAGLAATGLAVRLVYALAVVGRHPLIGDGLEFHLLANNLADGHGYVQAYLFRDTHRAVATAFKPPLYAFYLAGWSLLGASSYVAHHIATCLVGAGSVATIGLVGRRAGGDVAGLLAAAIAVVYPLLIAIDGSLRSEALDVLLVSLAMLAALRVLDAPGVVRAFTLGAIIAFAALTRAEGLVLLVLLALPIAWIAGADRRGRARLVASALVGATLVVAPWTVRNWITFDRPVLISTNGGGAVAGANCRQSYYGPFIGQWSFDCIVTHEPNEAVASAKLRGRGTDYARRHLGRAVLVAGVRVLRTWDLYAPRQQYRQMAFFEGRALNWEKAGIAMYYGLLLLATYGAVCLRRQRVELWILLAPLVLVTVSSALGYGFTRFRAAAEPAIVVLAAVALANLAARASSRVTPARPLTSR